MEGGRRAKAASLPGSAPPVFLDQSDTDDNGRDLAQAHQSPALLLILAISAACPFGLGSPEQPELRTRLLMTAAPLRSNY
jgi:hypothetical protein